MRRRTEGQSRRHRHAPYATHEYQQSLPLDHLLADWRRCQQQPQAGGASATIASPRNRAQRDDSADDCASANGGPALQPPLPRVRWRPRGWARSSGLVVVFRSHTEHEHWPAHLCPVKNTKLGPARWLLRPLGIRRFVNIIHGESPHGESLNVVSAEFDICLAVASISPLIRKQDLIAYNSIACKFYIYRQKLF